MIGYQVDVDHGQLREVESLLSHIKNGADKALTMGANKAGPKIRALASQRIRQQVRLQASYVNDHLKFQKATRANPTARIVTPTRGILLTRFSTDALIADPNKAAWARPPAVPARGIRVKVKPTGGAKTVHGPPGSASKPFYVRLRYSGRIGIAVRRADGKLNVLHGPSISQVFTDVKDEVLPQAGAEYAKEVNAAALYLVRKQALADG